MAVRWIRNVNIDGEETTIEVQIGYKVIGDKCYTRVGNEIEKYFSALKTNDRSEIVVQGKEILKQQLLNKKITYIDGRIYDWE
jgi:hypothetical protein